MDSEKQFLAKYRQSDYERPSVTADIALFKLRAEKPDSFRKEPSKKLSLLLIRRAEHPFRDCWALPGGFLKPGETIEQCALREVVEETGIIIAVVNHRKGIRMKKKAAREKKMLEAQQKAA